MSGVAATDGVQSVRVSPPPQARLQALVHAQCAVGRSLREIAEPTDRPFSAVHDILDDHGMVRPGVGAAVVAVGHDRRAGAS
jgi:predicted transcriptional regulator